MKTYKKVLDEIKAEPEKSFVFRFPVQAGGSSRINLINFLRMEDGMNGLKITWTEEKSYFLFIFEECNFIITVEGMGKSIISFINSMREWLDEIDQEGNEHVH